MNEVRLLSSLRSCDEQPALNTVSKGFHVPLLQERQEIQERAISETAFHKTSDE